MILRLVWKSLAQRPGRSALLLAGYALGVGVTIALLSIGGALLEQARDRSLIGGGDLTVLPEGLDLETFRTGGVSSLYFTLDYAPFLHRQVLAGPRFSDRVAAAAPWIDDELLYLRVDEELQPVSAGGQIPSLAERMGVRPRLLAGAWRDRPADRRWVAPDDSTLLASLDAFHLPTGPARGDSTWAEWHYFNILLAEPEAGDPEGEGWLYVTYMVAGAVPGGRWSGHLLATWVGPPDVDGRRPERRYAAEVGPEATRFSTRRPDLRIGPAAVRLTGDGTYRLEAEIPAVPEEDATGFRPPRRDTLRLALTVDPEPRRHLPRLDVSPGGFPSGYVVPAVTAAASGQVCVARRCALVRNARAYHDHNWGTWRDVTWDWGQAVLGPWALVYGGVRAGGEEGDASGESGPRFLFLTDPLGFAGLLRIASLEYLWSTEAPGPSGIVLRARNGGDSLELRVEVTHARATDPESGPSPRGEEGGVGSLFFQLRGDARLSGRLDGRSVAGRGDGFFEAWAERPARER